MKGGAGSLRSKGRWRRGFLPRRWLLLLTLLISTACAQVGKVTVIVTDYETGEPLSGFTVIAGFVSHDGMSAGPDNKSDCVTKSDGHCTIWGHGNGRQATVAVMNSQKYYGATDTIRFKGSLSPVASPWNPEVELRLKAIRNPIPMYAKNLNQKRFPEAVVPNGYDQEKRDWVPMPADHGTVGYDLQKGDWVYPFGEGVISDFVFNIVREPRVNYISEHGREHMASGATIDIMVSNEGDGFLAYPVAEKDRHRGLRLPHEAPVEGYEASVTRFNIRPPNKRSETNIDEDMNYFIRVRTEMDENGKIISALYGKVHGDFSVDGAGFGISFAYYLNPTPNDRNVEFKRKSSLIPNLKGTEDSLEP